DVGLLAGAIGVVVDLGGPLGDCLGDLTTEDSRHGVFSFGRSADVDREVDVDTIGGVGRSDGVAVRVPDCEHLHHRIRADRAGAGGDAPTGVGAEVGL